MKFDQLDPSLVAAVDMMHQNCFDLVMMTRITQAGPFMTKKIFVLPVFFFFLYLFFIYMFVADTISGQVISADQN